MTVFLIVLGAVLLLAAIYFFLLFKITPRQIENSAVLCDYAHRGLHGGGVPEKELPMLFRRFHRTENASPDRAGIGLSITKAIVEKHHGTITAENSEKGLRVAMCFPIIDANLKL